ncbi:MAG: transporter substrate-binding domain-containing protein [Actinobacteria bacterium]|nr:transporter substrate-binding domain-containing protein [Actinomycetota bacterium]
MEKSVTGVAVALVLTLVLAAGLILTGCGSSEDQTSAIAAADADTTPPAGTANAAGPSAATDVSSKTVQDRDALLVGMCAEYPPFEFRGDDNKPMGFDVDLANALGEKLGIKVTIADSAWEGLLAGIRKGDYDVLITAMSKKGAAAV